MRVSRQVVVIAAGLAVWSAWGEPSFAALVGSYAIGWLVVNAVVAVRPRLFEGELSRPVAALGAALVLVPPAAALWRARGAIADEESLVGLDQRVADRMRLERTPSIAPPILFADHPQDLYVWAEGRARVSARFGRARALDADALGAGLFRVHFDPRADGEPRAAEGSVEVTLTVDGSRVERELVFVRPLAHPRWLRASPDGSLAATVSEETDELVVVDDRGLLRRVATRDGPVDCGFVSPDRIAVSHALDRALVLVDVGSGDVAGTVDIGGYAGRMAVSPGLGRVAVAVDGTPPGVALVDVASMRVEAFVELDATPDWLAFGADDDTLVVSTRSPAALVRLRAGRTGLRAGRPLLLGRPAVTMARSPDGTTVVVATTDYRRGGAPHLGNHFIQDQLLTVDVAKMRVVGQLLTARRSPRQAKPGDVDRGGSPMGIDVLGPGVMRVTFAGTDEVWRIDPRRPEPSVVSLADVPLPAPHGVATFASGAFAVTSPSEGTIGIFTRAGELATLVRLTPDDDALLRRDPDALARRLGEHGFYESTRSGVACQSCHLHASSDGAMHNIGDRRLAPTLTVAGVAGTAPYLRDGSYPRIRDLDELSEELYRGFLRHAPGRALTLERYVEGLPRRPHLVDARDLRRERAGFAAFRKARCPTCHAPPAFTNLGQHPVGALFPERARELGADTVLDTPSLLGACDRVAFLSDGRATSLESVVRDHNRSNRHGDTASLDDGEIADLVFFLEAL